MVALVSSTLLTIESWWDRGVGNLPALFNPGPKILGICLIKVSEAKKALYFLAENDRKQMQSGHVHLKDVYFSEVVCHITIKGKFNVFIWSYSIYIILGLNSSYKFKISIPHLFHYVQSEIVCRMVVFSFLSNGNSNFSSYEQQETTEDCKVGLSQFH